MHSCDKLLLNVTTTPDAEGKTLEHQAIAIHNGLIAWCGAESEYPKTYYENAKERRACEVKVLLRA